LEALRVTRAGWLLRDGQVLAAAERADHLAERTRGLLGRSGYDGAMILARTRSVHTARMRFPLDVAFLDAELVVVGTCRLVPWRLALPRRRGRHVLEAQAGSFERWGLAVGDHLEFKGAS